MRKFLYAALAAAALFLLPQAASAGACAWSGGSQGRMPGGGVFVIGGQNGEWTSTQYGDPDGMIHFVWDNEYTPSGTVDFWNPSYRASDAYMSIVQYPDYAGDTGYTLPGTAWATGNGEPADMQAAIAYWEGLDKAAVILTSAGTPAWFFGNTSEIPLNIQSTAVQNALLGTIDNIAAATDGSSPPDGLHYCGVSIDNVTVSNDSGEYGICLVDFSADYTIQDPIPTCPPGDVKKLYTGTHTDTDTAFINAREKWLGMMVARAHADGLYAVANLTFDANDTNDMDYIVNGDGPNNPVAEPLDAWLDEQGFIGDPDCGSPTACDVNHPNDMPCEMTSSVQGATLGAAAVAKAHFILSLGSNARYIELGGVCQNPTSTGADGTTAESIYDYGQGMALILSNNTSTNYGNTFYLPWFWSENSYPLFPYYESTLQYGDPTGPATKHTPNDTYYCRQFTNALVVVDVTLGTADLTASACP